MKESRTTVELVDALIDVECRYLVLTQAANFVEQQMAADAADPSHAVLLRSESREGGGFASWLALPTLQELRAQAEKARIERDRLGALPVGPLVAPRGRSKAAGKRGMRAPVTAPDDAPESGLVRRLDMER